MKTKKKAISLIVLVITIIVLAILAATVIVTITNSGIINRATDTVKEHDLTEVRSMANLAWSEALIEYYEDPYADDNFYEWYVRDNLSSAGVNVNDYEITVTKDGVSVEEKVRFSKPITDLKAGDRVYYTAASGDTIPCVVLYDMDSGYDEVQIITEDLLFTDISVNGNSYETMIPTLNSYAENEMNSDGIATSGRCVGSRPDDPNYKEVGSTTADDDYQIDLAQMETLGIHDTTSGDYWFASIANENEMDVRYYSLDGGADSKCVIYFGSQTPQFFIANCGYRAVFTLNPDAKLVYGNGDTVPYELSL